MSGSVDSTIPPSRLQNLAAELRRQAPQWAARLASAKTDQELMEVVCKLFDLSVALSSSRNASRTRKDLSHTITQFIGSNLHKGLTLKILAQFLGYSEKYCSGLFQSAMGEPFSRYLRRRRANAAAVLLRTTDTPIVEIASALGFSDQFAFSHFFKRATGRSPSDFRVAHARRRSLRIHLSPPRKTP
jgi:AraC-like DNA-binding protein